MIISRVTSDSLHLSGLGGQTDGLSLISPESVVSTARRDTLKINSQSKREKCWVKKVSAPIKLNPQHLQRVFQPVYIVTFFSNFNYIGLFGG